MGEGRGQNSSEHQHQLQEEAPKKAKTGAKQKKCFGLFVYA